MTDWNLIEEQLFGAEDPEAEELERNLPCDGPMVRAFYGNKSTRERLIDAVKFLPVVFGFVLTWPFWFFYFMVYEEYIRPVLWKITDWWELIQWEHEHLPVTQDRPMTAKEKRDLVITGSICLVLLVIILLLAYLMETGTY